MQEEVGLAISQFESLGEFAPAGQRATALAIERARRSYDAGRVPIAGAAVYLDPSGNLQTVTVGHNGRIPSREPDAATHPDGYPTDHGETAAVRLVEDIDAWDWSRVVFTTTLSPCIMCGRTLSWLHGKGLRRIVIAEAQSFPGTKDLLAALPGMQVLELTNPASVAMMQGFARTWPWDWQADIGGIPPGDLSLARAAEDPHQRRAWLSALREDEPASGNRHIAGVLCPGGTFAARAADERGSHGMNPCFSAPMIAMGNAGSGVNLRECVLVFEPAQGTTQVDVEVFGHASLGACELFRPAAVVSAAPLESTLRAQLEACDVAVRT